MNSYYTITQIEAMQDQIEYLTALLAEEEKANEMLVIERDDLLEQLA